MNKVISRRKFIKKNVLLNWLIPGIAATLTGCKSRNDTGKEYNNGINTNPCEDMSGVSNIDIQARFKSGYVKQSPIIDKSCSNCKLHLPPKAGSECGLCLLFKGPVYLTGYCTYWAQPD